MLYGNDLCYAQKVGITVTLFSTEEDRAQRVATSCKTTAGWGHGHSLNKAWPAKDPAVIQPLPAQPCFSLCSEEQETQVFIEIYMSWLIQLFDNTLKTKPNWSADQIQRLPTPGDWLPIYNLLIRTSKGAHQKTHFQEWLVSQAF